MAEPNFVVVGHCTDTTARIFFCTFGGAPEGTAGRLRWHTDDGQSDIVEAETKAAAPFRIGVFEVTHLPAGRWVHYAVDVADSRDALATDEQLSGRPERKFRTLPNDRPLRVGFVSCNGVLQMKDPERRYVVWRQLMKEVESENVDVLVHGGDQIYADSVGEEYDRSYRGLPARKDDPEAVEKLAELYRVRYAQTWDSAEVSAVLGSVSNLMTWDDHDIYDGYGSHKDHDDRADPYAAYFQAARLAYLDFQVSHGPEPLHAESTLRAVKHNGVAIVLLDTRMNRDCRAGKVLGEEQRDALKRWTSDLAGIKRLYAVSSIPVLHAKVAGILAAIERHRLYSSLDDDLRDSWLASENLNECAALLKTLFGIHTRDGGPQVTVLAGDVHVATLSTLHSRLQEHVKGPVPPTIFQVTSSGIGTPPPPGWQRGIMGGVMGSDLPLGAPELTGRLMRVNGAEDIMVPRRNFVVLNLEDDAQTNAWDRHGNLRATYVVENDDDPTQCLVLNQVLNGPGAA